MKVALEFDRRLLRYELTFYQTTWHYVSKTV